MRLQTQIKRIQKLFLSMQLLLLPVLAQENVNEKYNLQNLDGTYLGQNSPGKIPEVFAPNILNYENGYHGTIVFSPDRTEAYWTPMAGGWGEVRFSKFINNSWSVPKKVQFGLNSAVSEPTFSPDGKKIYFLSTEPIKQETKKRRRIWFCKKSTEGWSKAALVSENVNKHPTHWSFSIAGNGNLYFTSEINEELSKQDIYMSGYNGKSYSDPIPISSKINTSQSDHTPYIAPDESYLIFTRGNSNKSDLYVSFKTKDNDWSEAKNLGSIINIGKHNVAPKVSPDGKYLFYLSYKTGDKFRIYWVDINVIYD